MNIEIAHEQQISQIFSENLGKICVLFIWTVEAWWDVYVKDKKRLISDADLLALGDIVVREFGGEIQEAVEKVVVY